VHAGKYRHLRPLIVRHPARRVNKYHYY